LDNFSARANYLCYLAQTLAQGNFQSNNFVVLPYLAPNTSQTIYFPDLPYPKKFWQILKKSPDLSAGIPFPHLAQTLAGALMPQTDLSLKLKTITDFWQKNSDRFWQKLKTRQLLQKEIGKIRTIKVLITQFGPGSSFNLIPNGKKLTVFLTMRVDQKDQEILRHLIYLFILIKRGKPGSSKEKWQQMRTLVNFICEELSLPDPKSSSPLTPKIVLASKLFLEKLGLGNKKNLAVKNNQIYLGERKISLRLSLNEELILRELIKLGGAILSHDRIAEILWKEKAADKFSLWGQTKLVQRVREKLAKEGASLYLIQTVYGRGYTLLE